MKAERYMLIACAIGCLLIALCGAARAEPQSEEEKSEAILETCVYAGFVAFPIVAVAHAQGLIPEFAPLHQYEWDRLEEDKRLHAEVEAKIGFGSAAFLFTFLPPVSTDFVNRSGTVSRYEPWHRWAFAGGTCLAVGLAKEAYDEAKRHAGLHRDGGDYQDLVADAAGCAVGVGAGAVLGMVTRGGFGIAGSDRGIAAVSVWRF